MMKNFLLALTLLGLANLSYSQIEDQRHTLYQETNMETLLIGSSEVVWNEANVPNTGREREPNFATSSKISSFKDNLLAILNDDFMVDDNYIVESIKGKSSIAETTKNHLNDEYHEAVSLSSDCDRISVLETMVANFDITQHESYSEKPDTFEIAFKEGDDKNGQINAVFDSEGNLLRSYERFKDIRLPRIVLDAINDEYPGAVIKTNTYIVTYNEQAGTNKIYKVKIDANGNKKSLKLDSNGKFI
ncbi:hypothetical protein RBH94_12615 [Aestuariibaculum sp. YM273]|uniref:hypothetical protein n=1 Tax=Aestuariibaculum sp. YM273 TaxID=3070659 RepID=UPI0027DC4809|nr:hypothetical protein [Aestuariibaculum sp. YM273]WMI64898.1 hypothetical protein RBH94_12615 [Aestuariibaculum sp. YM273]